MRVFIIDFIWRKSEFLTTWLSSVRECSLLASGMNDDLPFGTNIASYLVIDLSLKSMGFVFLLYIIISHNWVCVIVIVNPQEMDKRRFYLFIFIFFSQDPNTVCLAKWVFKILILLLYRMLEKRSLSYIDGPVPVPLDDSFLVENVQRICVCDTGSCLFCTNFRVSVCSCFWDLIFHCWLL